MKRLILKIYWDNGKMKNYEFTFDSEYGVYFGMIQAKNEKTFLEQLRKEYPHDKGADGLFHCPDTGDEKPIKWGEL